MSGKTFGVNKYLRLIDDTQSNVYPEKIIREKSDMKQQITVDFEEKYFWIFVLCISPSLIYFCQSIFTNSSPSPFILGGLFLLGYIIMCIIMIYNHAKEQKALDLWFNGMYRDSEWYKGLDDDGKAHVIGVMESDSYNIINERINDLRPRNKYNMWYAINRLNEAIKRDMALLNENSPMLNDDDRNKLRSMIAKYEVYRDTLKAKTYTEKLPKVASGSTDMNQYEEEKLIQAVNKYNKTVKKHTSNIPRIKKYEAMLRKYRETLIHHRNYNAGCPTSQALRDAETIAYAGFTM